MASDTDIFNLALNELGENRIIEIGEDSKAGRISDLIYNDTRDAVLREHPWNFAIKRVELALLLTTPAFEFANEHQLPSDFIRILKTDDDFVPHRIEGGKLLSDNDIVFIEYIARITDPTLFDTLFVETLSVRLAAKMAYNISDNNTLTQLLEQKYRDRLRQARAMDGQEGTPRTIEADQWLNTRF